MKKWRFTLNKILVRKIPVCNERNLLNRAIVVEILLKKNKDSPVDGGCEKKVLYKNLSSL
ncbi:hypothetical protein CKY02_20130 [Photorhabdus bodei]|uniref:Uncharacterized protein n=1 Tax=Photorhabdus bodei TaxID=2029681 RepID=A0A329WT67_9GAMM|nr:hypothetical protein CKY02_20130 [Photorhabdus bodei]